MRAFASPTINDFLGQLLIQTERLIRDFQRRKNEISATCAKAGATHSSRHVLLLLDAVDEHIERGVAILLGEVRRALSYPELDPDEIRNLILPRLNELADKIISEAFTQNLVRSLQSGQISEIASNRTKDIKEKLHFWWRQFEIGWDFPVNPEILATPPPR